MSNKVMTQATEPKKKLTYEELENVAHQLSEQCREMAKRLQNNDLNNVFRRLDFLFAVIQNKEAFAADHADFLKKCTDEIVSLITIPEQPENTPEVEQVK